MTLQSSHSDDQGGSNINGELRQVGASINQSITTPILGLEYWVGQMKPKLKLMER